MGADSNSPGGLPAAVRGASRALLQVAIVSLAYFLANLVALLFPDTDQILASIWPAGGVALASLLLSKRTRWLLLMAGVFIAGVAADLLGGRPLLSSLGFMTANVAESLTCAWVLQRLCGTAIRFERTTEATALVFAAIACNAVTALIGAGTAALAAHASFWPFWLTWWVADGLGIFLITPLIVTAPRAFHRLRTLGPGKAAETAAFVVIWCAVTWLIFQNTRHPVLIAPQPFILFALLVYAALRFGTHETLDLILLLTVLVLTSSKVREGGLFWGGDSEPERILLAQIYIAAVAVTGFYLSTVLTERRHAERELSEAKTELETVFEVSPLAMTLLDEHDRVRLWNRSAEKMFGWSREEVMGRPNPIVPASKENEYATWSAAVLRGQAIAEFEAVRRRKDGSPVEVSLSSAPVYDSEGMIAGRMAIVADITSRKRAEEELRKSLAEKEILLRELYHRTKNNMTVIISLLHMQAVQCGDESLRRAFDEAENRIYSMALVHQKLYESGDLSRVNLKSYLTDLCEYLIPNYVIDPGSITLTKELDDIFVQIDTAIPCGLIANELITNSLKHAFPDGRRGTITLTLRLQGDREILLRIADDGIGGGDLVELERNPGMGLRTVMGLGESQLNGRVTFASGPGFSCELRFMGQLCDPGS